jgi:RimJ/RimL family protein N-acetyltransferase
MDGSRAFARGENVWLRAFEDADLESYWAALNDADVAQWGGYVAPPSRMGLRGWYDQKIRMEDGRIAHYFVISPIGSDDFIGSIWLWNFDNRIGGPEVSSFISDRDRWGQGLGTDAVNAVTDFGFGSLSIDRIWLTTLVENQRAVRSFEKAGFVSEGILRKNDLRHGELVDSRMMSMVRSDWEALERKRSWEW